MTIYSPGGKMNYEFSKDTRRNIINSIEGKTYEVTIIGGGISGAGIANILAENGVSTLLVEKNDFSSGTSSGSSKLIHGGLRYLQNGRFLEVFRLLKERNYLIGHTDIVRPIEFHIFTGKKMWNRIELGIGMSLYNLLSGKFPLTRHVRNTGTYPDGIDGYYSYMDGITVDSELVIYNIVSAQRHGASCLNYMEAKEIKKSNGGYSITIYDNISGTYKTIYSRIVINAAGPWGNRLLEIAGIPTEQNFRLSKGIHIVFPFSIWGRKNAAVIKSLIDGRQLFIIPSGEVAYVGTTDKFTDNPDDFSINKEDIRYLVESISPFFPEFKEDKIIAAFSGIRVLLGTGNDPGKISRDFKISVIDNFISVLGGKITDYRVGARKTAKIVSGILNKPLKIKNMPYIDYSRKSQSYILTDKGVNHKNYIDYSKKSQSLEEIIKYECPVKPEDIIRRRLALSIYSLDLGKSLEEKIYTLMEVSHEDPHTGK